MAEQGSDPGSVVSTARSRSSPVPRRASARRPASRSADEGAAVVGIDIAEPSVPLAAFHKVDVTDEAAVAAAIDATVAEHGRLDVVATFAGVAGGGPVHTLDAAEWARVIAVNLTATFSRASTRCATWSSSGRAASSRSPASRGSKAPKAAARTTRRRAASSCSPRTWRSTTGAWVSASTASAPGSSTRRCSARSWAASTMGSLPRGVPRAAQARSLRPPGGDRCSRGVPRVRRRVVRHRARAGRRRRLHRRDAHRSERSPWSGRDVTALGG